MPLPWMAWTSPSSVSEARARRTVTRLTPNSSRSSRSVGSCSPGASSPRAIRPSSSWRTRAVSWPRPRGVVVTVREVTRDEPGLCLLSHGRSYLYYPGTNDLSGFPGRRPRGREADAEKSLDDGGGGRDRAPGHGVHHAGRRADRGGHLEAGGDRHLRTAGHHVECLDLRERQPVRDPQAAREELRGGEPQRQDQVDGPRLRHLPRADQARAQLRGRSGRRDRQPRLVARRSAHQGRSVPPARRLRQGLRLGHPLPRGRPAPAQVQRGRHGVRRGPDLGNPVRLRRHRLVLQQGPARRARHGAPDDLRGARGDPRRVEGRRTAADRVRQQGRAGPHGTCSTT